MNIKEYNQMKYEMYKQIEIQNKYPGITCECGRQLEFYDDNICVSYPPKRKAWCRKCGFTDYVIV
jgi:hypothetical protein